MSIIQGGRSLDLLEDLAAGQAGAWEALVQEATDLLFQSAYGVLRNIDDANDVVQEVCLQLRDHASRFRARCPNDEAGAERWLQRLAVNAALNWRRGEWRRRQRQAKALVLNPVGTGGDGQAELEQQELLRQLLTALQPQERAVVLLHYLHGLDHHGLAAELQCRPATARKRLQRALDKLRGLSRQRRFAYGALVAALSALTRHGQAASADLPRQIVLQTSVSSTVLAPHLVLGGIGIMKVSLLSLACVLVCSFGTGALVHAAGIGLGAPDGAPGNGKQVQNAKKKPAAGPFSESYLKKLAKTDSAVVDKLKQKVTLEMEDCEVSAVAAMLGNFTGLKIRAEDNVAAKHFDLKAKDEPLSQVLNDLCSALSLQATVADGAIVLSDGKPKKKAPAPGIGLGPAPKRR